MIINLTWLKRLLYMEMHTLFFFGRLHKNYCFLTLDFQNNIKTSPKENKYSPLEHYDYIRKLVKCTISILPYGDYADWRHFPPKKTTHG